MIDELRMKTSLTESEIIDIAEFARISFEILSTPTCLHMIGLIANEMDYTDKAMAELRANIDKFLYPDDEYSDS